MAELTLTRDEEIEYLTLALMLLERERRDDGYRIGLDALAARYDMPEQT